MEGRPAGYPDNSQSPSSKSELGSSSHSPTARPTQPRSKRTQVACTGCRKRQIKCQPLPGGPDCERCRKKGFKCEYIPIPKKTSTERVVRTSASPYSPHSSPKDEIPGFSYDPHPQPFRGSSGSTTSYGSDLYYNPEYQGGIVGEPLRRPHSAAPYTAHPASPHNSMYSRSPPSAGSAFVHVPFSGQNDVFPRPVPDMISMGGHEIRDARSGWQQFPSGAVEPAAGDYNRFVLPAESVYPLHAASVDTSWSSYNRGAVASTGYRASISSTEGPAGGGSSWRTEARSSHSGQDDYIYAAPEQRANAHEASAAWSTGQGGSAAGGSSYTSYSPPSGEASEWSEDAYARGVSEPGSRPPPGQ